MTEAIVVALITGILAFFGTLVANNRAQAVMDTKIEELTREVREHNEFARRLPLAENEIKHINRRLEELEEGKK